MNAAEHDVTVIEVPEQRVFVRVPVDIAMVSTLAPDTFRAQVEPAARRELERQAGCPLLDAEVHAQWWADLDHAPIVAPYGVEHDRVREPGESPVSWGEPEVRPGIRWDPEGGLPDVPVWTVSLVLWADLGVAWRPVVHRVGEPVGAQLPEGAPPVADTSPGT